MVMISWWLKSLTLVFDWFGSAILARVLQFQNRKGAPSRCCSKMRTQVYDAIKMQYDLVWTVFSWESPFHMLRFDASYQDMDFMNTAARIVTGTKRSDHITPVLKSLHWLPVQFRIDFKVLVIIFKCIHGLVPAYLSDLLQVYTSHLGSFGQTEAMLCL